MSREEILKNHFRIDDTFSINILDKERIYAAMDEYAKQVAIEYGDWLIRTLMPTLRPNDGATQEQKESLYSLFQEETQRKSSLK